MSLASRIASNAAGGARQVRACDDPYKVSCARPAGHDGLCSGSGGTQGYRDGDVPVWRQKALADLAKRGYVATKELS